MKKYKNLKRLNSQELQNPSEKHNEKLKTILIIAGLVVFAVVSVYALFAFIMRAAHRDPGYYRLEAEKNDEAPLYAGNFAFEHYFEGESIEIKYAVDACSQKYSGLLARIFKLTDAKNLYDGCKNIAYINAHPGEEVEIEKELFSILSSAAELTARGEFNMLAGALQSTWSDIIYSNAPQEFDPMLNEVQRNRIAAAVKCAGDPNFFKFEIVDEASRRVRISVSEQGAAFMHENDFEPLVLDLGFLRDAFIIDTVCALMEAEGYDNGYMSSVNGASRALKSMGEGHEYVAYGMADGEAAQAYSLPMLPSSSCCALRAFGMEGELGYYGISAEGGELLRHPNISLETGEVSDTALSACAYSSGGTAVEACLAAHSLMSAKSPAELEAALSEGGSMLRAFILKSEPISIHASAGHENVLKCLNGFKLSER